MILKSIMASILVTIPKLKISGNQITIHDDNSCISRSIIGYQITKSENLKYLIEEIIKRFYICDQEILLIWFQIKKNGFSIFFGKEHYEKDKTKIGTLKVNVENEIVNFTQFLINSRCEYEELKGYSIKSIIEFDNDIFGLKSRITKFFNKTRIFRNEIFYLQNLTIRASLNKLFTSLLRNRNISLNFLINKINGNNHYFAFFQLFKYPSGDSQTEKKLIEILQNSNELSGIIIKDRKIPINLRKLRPQIPIGKFNIDKSDFYSLIPKITFNVSLLFPPLFMEKNKIVHSKNQISCINNFPKNKMNTNQENNDYLVPRQQSNSNFPVNRIIEKLEKLDWKLVNTNQNETILEFTNKKIILNICFNMKNISRNTNLFQETLIEEDSNMMKIKQYFSSKLLLLLFENTL